MASAEQVSDNSPYRGPSPVAPLEKDFSSGFYLRLRNLAINHGVALAMACAFCMMLDSFLVFATSVLEMDRSCISSGWPDFVIALGFICVIPAFKITISYRRVRWLLTRLRPDILRAHTKSPDQELDGRWYRAQKLVSGSIEGFRGRGRRVLPLR